MRKQGKGIFGGVIAMGLAVALLTSVGVAAAFADDGALTFASGASAGGNAVSAEGASADVAGGKQTVKDGVYLLALSSKAKQVVAFAGSSKKSGASAQVAAFAATSKQTFRVEYDGSGFYTVTSVHSGKKLATASKKGSSPVKVGQYSLDTSSRAKWRIDRYRDGYRLVNKATGLALEVAGSKRADGSSVHAAQRADSGKAQKFSLVRPGDLAPAASKVKGVRYIAMAADRKSVLGMRDDSRKEGASVRVRGRHKSNLVRFSIKDAGKGTYYLQNVATKRVVSLQKKTKAAGVKLVMRDKGAASYKRWKIVYNDDFTFGFVNAYSGKRLHVTAGKTAANTKVTARKAKTSSDAQRFRLVKAHVIHGETVTINVPCYLQNPQLPTGCESVALTNAIRYWGHHLGKTTIADKWMPYGNDGVYNFIGNPRNSSGWIICAPGIANTANAYLKSVGSKVRAHVVKGESLAKVRQNLKKGYPVVVWTTIGMGAPGGVQASKGGYPLRSNNHAVVLSGYDPQTGKYRVSDSLAGVVWRDGAQFKRLYNLMGRQAVVLSR